MFMEMFLKITENSSSDSCVAVVLNYFQKFLELLTENIFDKNIFSLILLKSYESVCIC